MRDSYVEPSASWPCRTIVPSCSFFVPCWPLGFPLNNVGCILPSSGPLHVYTNGFPLSSTPCTRYECICGVSMKIVPATDLGAGPEPNSLCAISSFQLPTKEGLSCAEPTETARMAHKKAIFFMPPPSGNPFLGDLPALKRKYQYFPYLPIGSKKCFARGHGFSIRRHLRICHVGDLSIVLPYDVTGKQINLCA